MIFGRAWGCAEVCHLQTAMRLSKKRFSAVVGVEESTVGRWRSGVTPGSDSQTKLDHALAAADTAAQKRFAELLSSRPERTEPGTGAAADAGLDGPWTPEAALRAITAVADSEDMQRRHFLPLVGAALTAPAHQWLVTPTTTTGPSNTHGARVSPATVDQVDAVTATLRHADDQHGAGMLLAMVRTHLRHVTDLLHRGTYTDSVGRRLLSSTAELLRLAGWLSFDNGDHAAAQRYWVAALRTAHSGGDRELAANILGFMSCQAKDTGAIYEATLLADTAHAGYRGSSPRVSTILHLRAAEAHACYGAYTDARRAIDAALTSFDADSTPNPEWSYWLDGAQVHAQTGFAFLRLGEHAQARDHLHTALNLQDDTSAREGVLRYILLATTHLQGSHTDLEHALSYARTATALLSSQVNSMRCVRHLTHMHTLFTDYRHHPAVQDLTQQIHTLHSSPNNASHKKTTR